jgi:dihydrofolate reductase
MTTTQTKDTRQLVNGLFMSLDGIVEADNDWQFAYFDDELFAGITAGWARAGAVLMGRRSFAGYDRLRHEHPDSPAVHFLDSVPKYVASNTLTEVEWPGTTVLGDELEGELDRLRTEPGKDILVLGSPTLVRWLLAQKLLDALTLTVLPIIVGSGVRLFEDMKLPTGPLAMRLDLAHPLASGALELRYTFA